MSNRFSAALRRTARLVVAIAALVAASCTSLRPGFETPSVTVNSFRMLPSPGAVPRFEIGLEVTNPNREPLKLAGVSYSVRLDGQEFVKGVSNLLPVIPAYGSGDVTLTATPNLLTGARLIADLMSGPRDSVSYTLEAKLDVGAFIPAIRVRDTGEISLRGTTN